jgi:hypothetical protein
MVTVQLDRKFNKNNQYTANYAFYVQSDGAVLATRYVPAVSFVIRRSYYQGQPSFIPGSLLFTTKKT